MQVSAKQAALLRCGICGHTLGPVTGDAGHSRKDLMRCLYTSNIGIVQIMKENQWVRAEKKYGDLPRGQPKNTEQIKEGDATKGFIYIYEDSTTITTNDRGEIIDVKRPKPIVAQDLKVDPASAQDFIGNKTKKTQKKKKVVNVSNTVKKGLKEKRSKNSD